jgi:hypothetical protein
VLGSTLLDSKLLDSLTLSAQDMSDGINIKITRAKEIIFFILNSPFVAYSQNER